MSLSAVGADIKPLLAVGSVSTGQCGVCVRSKQHTQRAQFARLHAPSSHHRCLLRLLLFTEPSCHHAAAPRSGCRLCCSEHNVQLCGGDEPGEGVMRVHGVCAHMRQRWSKEAGRCCTESTWPTPQRATSPCPPAVHLAPLHRGRPRAAEEPVWQHNCIRCGHHASIARGWLWRLLPALLLPLPRMRPCTPALCAPRRGGAHRAHAHYDSQRQQAANVCEQ